MLILNVLLSAILIILIEGSCYNNCCNGKNSNCKSYDKLLMKTCYCDSYCYRSQDCCSDYKDFCLKPKVNCIVSNWNDWSECSRNCGRGIKSRTRKIIVSPKNGGRKCKQLKQTKKCSGMICAVHHVSGSNYQYHDRPEEPRNVARLLPDFGGLTSLYQTYSQQYDIRKHIFHRNIHRLSSLIKKGDPYCVIYKITLKFGTCSRLERLSTEDRANWSQHYFYLKPKQTICATCYAEHQKYVPGYGFQCEGTGKLHENTRWRAIRSDDCHGYFMMIEKKESCICKNIHSFLII